MPVLLYERCWKGVREGKEPKVLQQREAEAVPGCPEEHCMRGSPCCLLRHV